MFWQVSHSRVVLHWAPLALVLPRPQPIRQCRPQAPDAPDSRVPGPADPVCLDYPAGPVCLDYPAVRGPADPASQYYTPTAVTSWSTVPRSGQLVTAPPQGQFWSWVHEC